MPVYFNSNQIINISAQLRGLTLYIQFQSSSWIPRKALLDVKFGDGVAFGFAHVNANPLSFVNSYCPSELELTRECAIRGRAQYSKKNLTLFLNNTFEIPVDSLLLLNLSDVITFLPNSCQFQGPRPYCSSLPISMRLYESHKLSASFEVGQGYLVRGPYPLTGKVQFWPNIAGSQDVFANFSVGLTNPYFYKDLLKVCFPRNFLSVRSDINCSFPSRLLNVSISLDYSCLNIVNNDANFSSLQFNFSCHGFIVRNNSGPISESVNLETFSEGLYPIDKGSLPVFPNFVQFRELRLDLTDKAWNIHLVNGVPISSLAEFEIAYDSNFVMGSSFSNLLFQTSDSNFTERLIYTLTSLSNNRTVVSFRRSGSVTIPAWSNLTIKADLLNRSYSSNLKWTLTIFSDKHVPLEQGTSYLWVTFFPVLPLSSYSNDSSASATATISAVFPEKGILDYSQMVGRKVISIEFHSCYEIEGVSISLSNLFGIENSLPTFNGYMWEWNFTDADIIALNLNFSIQNNTIEGHLLDVKPKISPNSKFMLYSCKEYSYRNCFRPCGQQMLACSNISMIVENCTCILKGTITASNYSFFGLGNLSLTFSNIKNPGTRQTHFVNVQDPSQTQVRALNISIYDHLARIQNSSIFLLPQIERSDLPGVLFYVQPAAAKVSATIGFTGLTIGKCFNGSISIFIPDSFHLSNSSIEFLRSPFKISQKNVMTRTQIRFEPELYMPFNKRVIANGSLYGVLTNYWILENERLVQFRILMEEATPNQIVNGESRVQNVTLLYPPFRSVSMQLLGDNGINTFQYVNLSIKIAFSKFDLHSNLRFNVSLPDSLYLRDGIRSIRISFLCSASDCIVPTTRDVLLRNLFYVANNNEVTLAFVPLLPLHTPAYYTCLDAGPEFDEILFVIPNVLLSNFETKVGIVSIELQRMEFTLVAILNRTDYNISEIISPYIIKSSVIEFVPSVINSSYIQTSFTVRRPLSEKDRVLVEFPLYFSTTCRQGECSVTELRSSRLNSYHRIAAFLWINGSQDFPQALNLSFQDQKSVSFILGQNVSIATNVSLKFEGFSFPFVPGQETRFLNLSIYNGSSGRVIGRKEYTGANSTILPNPGAAMTYLSPNVAGAQANFSILFVNSFTSGKYQTVNITTISDFKFDFSKTQIMVLIGTSRYVNVSSVIRESLYLTFDIQIDSYALVEVMLSHVYNPPTSGRLNKLAFTVLDQSPLNYSVSVLADILTTPGEVLHPKMNISSYYPGQQIQVNLSFQVSNSVPVRGQIDIELKNMSIFVNALQLIEAYFEDELGTRTYFIGNLTNVGQNISITVISIFHNTGIRSFSVIPSLSHISLYLAGLQTLPTVTRVFFSIQTKQYFGDYIDTIYNVEGPQMQAGTVVGILHLEIPYVSTFTLFALHLFPSIDFVCGYSITVSFPRTIQKVNFTNYSDILGSSCEVSVKQASQGIFQIYTQKQIQSNYWSNHSTSLRNLTLVGYLRTPAASGTYKNIFISILNGDGLIDLGQANLSVTYSEFSFVGLYAKYDFYRGGLSAETLGSNYLTISIRPSVSILGRVFLILEFPYWLAKSNPRRLECKTGICIQTLARLNRNVSSLPFNSSMSFIQLVDLVYVPKPNVSISFTLQSFFIPSRYILLDPYIEIKAGFMDEQYRLIQVGTARLNLSQSKLQQVPVLTPLSGLPSNDWNRSTCKLPNAVFWLNNYTVSGTSFFQVFSFMINQKIPKYGLVRIIIPLNQFRLANVSTYTSNSTVMVNYRSCSYPLRNNCTQNSGEVSYVLNASLEISIKLHDEVPNDAIIDLFNLSQSFPFLNPIYSERFLGNYSVFTLDNLFSLIDTSDLFIPQYCYYNTPYNLTFEEILRVYFWDERAISQQYDQLYIRNEYYGGNGGFFFNLTFRTGIRTNESIWISFPRDFEINHSNIDFFENCLLTLGGECRNPEWKKEAPQSNTSNGTLCINTTISNCTSKPPSYCLKNCSQYSWEETLLDCTNITLPNGTSRNGTNGTIAETCTNSTLITNISECVYPYFVQNQSKLCRNTSVCQQLYVCKNESLIVNGKNISICTNVTNFNGSNVTTTICVNSSQVNSSLFQQRCMWTSPNCTLNFSCENSTLNCTNLTQCSEVNETFPCPQNSSTPIPPQCPFGHLRDFKYAWQTVNIPSRSQNPPDLYEYHSRQTMIIKYLGNETLMGFSFSLNVTNPLYGLGYPPDINDRYSYLVVLKGLETSGWTNLGIQERIEFQILIFPQLLTISNLTQNATAGALAQISFSFDIVEILGTYSPALSMLFPAGSYGNKYRLNTGSHGSILYFETFASFSQTFPFSFQILSSKSQPCSDCLSFQNSIFTQPSKTNATPSQLCIDTKYPCSNCLSPANSFAYQQQYLFINISQAFDSPRSSVTNNSLTITINDVFRNPLQANILPGYFDFVLSGEFYNQRQIIARAFGVAAAKTTAGNLTVEQVNLIQNVVNRESKINISISLLGVLTNESYLEIWINPNFTLYLRNATFISFSNLQYEIHNAFSYQNLVYVFLADYQIREMYKSMEITDAIQSTVSVSFCCVKNPPYVGDFQVIEEIRAMSYTNLTTMSLPRSLNSSPGVLEFQGYSFIKSPLLEDYNTIHIQVLMILENEFAFGKGGLVMIIKFNQTIYAGSTLKVSFPSAPSSLYELYPNVFYDVQSLKRLTVSRQLNRTVETQCYDHLGSACFEPSAANLSILDSNDPSQLYLQFGSNIYPCAENCSNSSFGNGLIALSIYGQLQNPRRPESNLRLNVTLYFRQLMEVRFPTEPLSIQAFEAPYASLYSSNRFVGLITWLEIEYTTISGMQTETKDYIEITLPKGYTSYGAALFNATTFSWFYPGSISCLKTPLYTGCISYETSSLNPVDHSSHNIGTQVLGHTRGIYGTLRLTRTSNNSLIFERCSDNFDVPFNTTIFFRFGPISNPFPGSISYTGYTLSPGNFTVRLKDQNDNLIEYAQIVAPPTFPAIFQNLSLSGKVFELDGARSGSVSSFQASFETTFELLNGYEIQIMLPEGYFIDHSFNYSIYEMNNVIQNSSVIQKGHFQSTNFTVFAHPTDTFSVFLRIELNSSVAPMRRLKLEFNGIGIPRGAVQQRLSNFYVATSTSRCKSFQALECPFVIQSNYAINYFPPTLPGQIRNINVSRNSSAAGNDALLTFSFDSSNAFPADGVIDVSLPLGFEIRETLNLNLNNFTCLNKCKSSSCTSYKPPVIVSISNPSSFRIQFKNINVSYCETESPIFPPGLQMYSSKASLYDPQNTGIFVSFSVFPVRLRQYSGQAGVFSLNIFDGQGSQTEEGSISAEVVYPNKLLSASLQQLNQVALDNQGMLFRFQVFNPIPKNGAVAVRFPTGYATHQARILAAWFGWSLDLQNAYFSNATLKRENDSILISFSGSVSRQMFMNVIIENIDIQSYAYGEHFGISTYESLGQNVIDFASNVNIPEPAPSLLQNVSIHMNGRQTGFELHLRSRVLIQNLSTIFFSTPTSTAGAFNVTGFQVDNQTFCQESVDPCVYVRKASSAPLLVSAFPEVIYEGTRELIVLIGSNFDPSSSDFQVAIGQLYSSSPNSPLKILSIVTTEVVILELDCTSLSHTCIGLNSSSQKEMLQVSTDGGRSFHPSTLRIKISPPEIACTTNCQGLNQSSTCQSSSNFSNCICNVGFSGLDCGIPIILPLTLSKNYFPSGSSDVLEMNVLSRGVRLNASLLKCVFFLNDSNETFVNLNYDPLLIEHVNISGSYAYLYHVSCNLPSEAKGYSVEVDIYFNSSNSYKSGKSLTIYLYDDVEENITKHYRLQNQDNIYFFSHPWHPGSDVPHSHIVQIDGLDRYVISRSYSDTYNCTYTHGSYDERCIDTKSRHGHFFVQPGNNATVVYKVKVQTPPLGLPAPISFAFGYGLYDQVDPSFWRKLKNISMVTGLIDNYQGSQIELLLPVAIQPNQDIRISFQLSASFPFPNGSFQLAVFPPTSSCMIPWNCSRMIARSLNITDFYISSEYFVNISVVPTNFSVASNGALSFGITPLKPIPSSSWIGIILPKYFRLSSVSEIYIPSENWKTVEKNISCRNSTSLAEDVSCANTSNSSMAGNSTFEQIFQLITTRKPFPGTLILNQSGSLMSRVQNYPFPSEPSVLIRTNSTIPAESFQFVLTNVQFPWSSSLRRLNLTVFVAQGYLNEDLITQYSFGLELPPLNPGKISNIEIFSETLYAANLFAVNISFRTSKNISKGYFRIQFPNNFQVLRYDNVTYSIYVNDFDLTNSTSKYFVENDQRSLDIRFGSAIEASANVRLQIGNIRASQFTGPLHDKFHITSFATNGYVVDIGEYQCNGSCSQTECCVRPGVFESAVAPTTVLLTGSRNTIHVEITTTFAWTSSATLRAFLPIHYYSCDNVTQRELRITRENGTDVCSIIITSDPAKSCAPYSIDPNCSQSDPLCLPSYDHDEVVSVKVELLNCTNVFDVKKYEFSLDIRPPSAVTRSDLFEFQFWDTRCTFNASSLCIRSVIDERNNSLLFVGYSNLSISIWKLSNDSVNSPCERLSLDFQPYVPIPVKGYIFIDLPPVLTVESNLQNTVNLSVDNVSVSYDVIREGHSISIRLLNAGVHKDSLISITIFCIRNGLIQRQPNVLEVRTADDNFNFFQRAYISGIHIHFVFLQSLTSVQLFCIRHD
eukprot:747640-Hanusia_phi.AAC.2